MATALTLSATNPLSNPLKTSNYGIRRKPSMQADGASVYHHRKNSFASPLAKHAYSIPSPVLVVKPSYSSSPRSAKPNLQNSPRHSKPSYDSVPKSTHTPTITTSSTSTSTSSTITIPTTSTTTPSTSTSTTIPTTTPSTPVNGLKLSYAEVLKSSGTLRASAGALKSSGTTTIPTSTLPPSQDKSKIDTKMDKKLNFEVERAKLKARRLAKKGYQRETGKSWSGDATGLEWEIYQAQIKKHEEALLQKKQDEEIAVTLANNIKHKEIVLAQLQTDHANKTKLIETGKEELEKFRLDFEESLRQLMPSSSSVQKSSSVRMQEEQQKKKLRAAWRNNDKDDDPVHQTRRNVMVAQEDVASLNLRINQLKKELALMKDIAAKEQSSKQIMRDERHKREEMQRKGIPRPKAEPRPKLPPAPPVARSHQTRMAEQQALKAKARAARLANASSSSSSSSSSVQCP